MIKYKAKFNVFHGVIVGVPTNVKFGGFFRCDFSTGAHFAVCQITYMGSDEIMQENTWYPGEISIIDAESYPPVGNKFFEPIKLHQKYYLHVGIDVIGRCELEEVMEITK